MNIIIKRNTISSNAIYSITFNKDIPIITYALYNSLPLVQIIDVIDYIIFSTFCQHTSNITNRANITCLSNIVYNNCFCTLIITILILYIQYYIAIFTYSISSIINITLSTTLRCFCSNQTPITIFCTNSVNFTVQVINMVNYTIATNVSCIISVNSSYITNTVLKCT